MKQVSNLRVSVTCAMRVQRRNANTEYHTVLSHLFSRESERGGNTYGSAQLHSIHLAYNGYRGPVVSKTLVKI